MSFARIPAIHFILQNWIICCLPCSESQPGLVETAAVPDRNYSHPPTQMPTQNQLGS